MLTQGFVALRHRIMPGLIHGVRLVRLGRGDAVSATQDVNYVRYKSNSKTERKSMIGPVKEMSAIIHFYRIELGDWVLQEDDIVVVNGSEWWRIDSIDRRQMQTKFICTCLASAPLSGIGSLVVQNTFIVG